MKKAITLFLVGIYVYTLCACSNGTSKKIKTEADAVGTYKSVGLFFEEEYHLNENTTFDIINAKSSNGHNGTYSVTAENSISLKPFDSVKLEINVKDNLYYITGF